MSAHKRDPGYIDQQAAERALDQAGFTDDEERKFLLFHRMLKMSRRSLPDVLTGWTTRRVDRVSRRVERRLARIPRPARAAEESEPTVNSLQAVLLEKLPSGRRVYSHVQRDRVFLSVMQREYPWPSRLVGRPPGNCGGVHTIVSGEPAVLKIAA